MESTSAYEPRVVEVESRLSEDWQRRGLFNPDTQPNVVAGRAPFVMCLPPPNVTGNLHIGHALAFAIEDTIGRWHRMRGRPVLLLPGTDHAGIATQAVVERQLAEQGGPTRREMGRSAFLGCVHVWSEEKRAMIRHQMWRLGVSADWSREFFTFSPELSVAVRTAFRRLSAAGQLYRGDRVVNWCCALQSVVSDVEVEWREVCGPDTLRLPGGQGEVAVGRLHEFVYPLEGGGEIPVATSRPETMLGDCAVAVHPDDTRHQAAIGKTIRHPLCPHRSMPVIADTAVDPQLGTGAVKLTPGHSAVDFDIAQRHSLPIINILNDDGTLNANAGPQFQGLSRVEARRAVLDVLASRGLLRGAVDHRQMLPVCSRTGDLLEPVVRPQWYVRCSGEMSQRALHAVESGELRIQPAGYVAEWREWMSRCQDWCVSRQLWWGHRVPAWYRRDETGELEWTVPTCDEEEGSLRESSDWHQDEDVLDTWFSSALLPFSAVGWPDTGRPDLASFFPNSSLETGHDILFFWVARMVMLGLQLTDQLPFNHVFLHGLVCDVEGRKMSKSRGNVIDPLSLVEGRGRLRKDQSPRISSMGADALRLALVSYNTSPLQINFSEDEVLKHRKFLNKMWNTLRFLFANLESSVDFSQEALERIDTLDLDLMNRWFLDALARLIVECDTAMHQQHFHLLCDAVTLLWREQLSNDFIPLTRHRLSDPGFSGRVRQQQLLCLGVDTCLRLLHPVAPFATDFMWRALMEARGTSGWEAGLSVSAFPSPDAAQAWNMEQEERQGVDAALKACASVRRWMQLSQDVKTKAIHVESECGDWARDFAHLVQSKTRLPVVVVGSDSPVSLRLPLLPGRGVRLCVDQSADVEGLVGSLRRSLDKMRTKRRALETRAISRSMAEEMERAERQMGEVEAEIGSLESARLYNTR